MIQKANVIKETVLREETSNIARKTKHVPNSKILYWIKGTESLERQIHIKVIFSV